MGFDQAKQAIRGARATAPSAMTSGQRRRGLKSAKEQLKKLGEAAGGVGEAVGGLVGDAIDYTNIAKGFHEEGFVGAGKEVGKKVLGDAAAQAGAELGAFLCTPGGPACMAMGGLVGGVAGSMGVGKLVEQWEKAAEEARAREDRWRATKEGIAADLQRGMAERERIKREKEKEEARRKDEERKKQRKQDSDQSAFVKALSSCNFNGAKTLVDAQESGDFKSYLEGLYESARTDLKIGNGTIAEAHELNQSCRFDEALAKLEAAKQGPKCEKYRDILAKNVAAVKKDQKHEKAIKAMQNDANRLNQSCRFDEAMEKLEAAQNQTSCDGSRRKLGDMMAMVNQGRQNMEQTLGLLEQAQGLYQQGDLKGSLAALRRASQHAECDKQHATIDNAIAAIQSRSKGQDVAGMVCEDDRRQPVKAADGGIVCACKDGLSELQGFCLTPQEVAQVQPTTNPDEWIEAISTIGTIIGIVGIIAGASARRPPSGGFSPSAPGQQKAQKCHPRPDGKGWHCSPG